MQTSFKNLSDLINNIEVNQPLYIENYIKPTMSRLTLVKRKQSYFFTVIAPDGRESWIINGATEKSKYTFNFLPDENKVQIFWKQDNSPFVTLFFGVDVLNKSINQYAVTNSTTIDCQLESTL